MNNELRWIPLSDGLPNQDEKPCWLYRKADAQPVILYQGGFDEHLYSHWCQIPKHEPHPLPTNAEEAKMDVDAFNRWFSVGVHQDTKFESACRNAWNAALQWAKEQKQDTDIGNEIYQIVNALRRSTSQDITESLYRRLLDIDPPVPGFQKQPECHHIHGATYNDEHNNYYCNDCNKGMGISFYHIAHELDKLKKQPIEKMLEGLIPIGAEKRFNGQPDRCPVCDWGNSLMNYGEFGVPIWMCHGCAGRAIRAEKQWIKHVDPITKQQEQPKVCFNCGHDKEWHESGGCHKAGCDCMVFKMIEQPAQREVTK